MAVDYAENFREEHFIRRGQGVRGRGGRGLQCYAGFKDGDINWDIMGLCNHHEILRTLFGGASEKRQCV